MLTETRRLVLAVAVLCAERGLDFMGWLSTTAGIGLWAIALALFAWVAFDLIRPQIPEEDRAPWVSVGLLLIAQAAMLVLYFVSRPSAIGIFKEPATHSWTETYERGKESYPTTKGNLREGPYYTFELVEWSLDSAQFEFGGYFPGCASTCPKLLGFSVGLREDCWAAVRVDDDAAELRVLVEDLELPRLKLWVGLIEGRAAREPASDWGIWGGQIRISEGCGRDGLMEYITP